MEQWGHGIFENGSNLDVVAAFDKKAGLKKLQNQVNAITSDPAKHVTYSIYAKQCSGPHAVESVRKHLNSGVLAKLAAKQIQSYFNPLKVSDWTCQGQTCCILAACAMSLGCITFTDLEGCKFVRSISRSRIFSFLDSADLELFQTTVTSTATSNSRVESFQDLPFRTTPRSSSSRPWKPSLLARRTTSAPRVQMKRLRRR